MNTYNIKKDSIREQVIEWQNEFACHNYSYGELVEWQAYFGKMGKRYGLLKEFRENGIC